MEPCNAQLSTGRLYTDFTDEQETGNLVQALTVPKKSDVRLRRLKEASKKLSNCSSYGTCELAQGLGARVISKISCREKTETVGNICMPYNAIPVVSHEEKLSRLINVVNYAYDTLACNNSFSKCTAECSKVQIQHSISRARAIYTQYRIKHKGLKNLLDEKCNEVEFLWHYYFRDASFPIPFTLCSKSERIERYKLAGWMAELPVDERQDPTNTTEIKLAPNAEHRTRFKGLGMQPVIPLQIARTNYKLPFLAGDLPEFYKDDFQRSEFIKFNAENIELGTLDGERAKRLSEFLFLGREEIFKRYFPKDKILPLQCWNFVQFVHSGETAVNLCFRVTHKKRIEKIIHKLDKLSFFHPLYMYANGEPCHAVFYLGGGLVVSMMEGDIIFSKLRDLIPVYSPSGEKVTIGIVKDK